VAPDSLPEMLEAICHQPPLPPSQAVVERGELPPEGAVAATPEERARLRSTHPIPLSRRLAGPLDRTLLRALAKDPRDLQSGAAELAHELAACRRDDREREALLDVVLGALAERSP